MSDAKRDSDRAKAKNEPKSISTGPNARPRNETISSTGPGLPDDTSEPIDIDPEEEKRIAAKIRSM